MAKTQYEACQRILVPSSAPTAALSALQQIETGDSIIWAEDMVCEEGDSRDDAIGNLERVTSDVMSVHPTYRKNGEVEVSVKATLIQKAARWFGEKIHTVLK